MFLKRVQKPYFACKQRNFVCKKRNLTPKPNGEENDKLQNKA